MYSWVMLEKKLPVGGHVLLKEGEELEKLKQMIKEGVVPEQEDTGYLIEADIRIPEKTELNTDCLPLCLMKAKDIKGSKHTRKLTKKLKGNIKGEKLLVTHLPCEKELYLLDYLQYLVRNHDAEVK